MSNSTTSAMSVYSADGQEYDNMAYERWLESIQQQFKKRVGDQPVFQTSVTGLWDTYLDALDQKYRQFHNCNTCRHFFERYAGLVTIDPETGGQKSAFWSAEDAPVEYKLAVERIISRVMTAKVSGVFVSREPQLGQHHSAESDWTHIYLDTPLHLRKFVAPTPHQYMASKREDHKNIKVALAEFSIELLGQAVSLLQSDALFRSEKVQGPAAWLHRLAVKRSENRRSFDNVLWSAIATAPAGFCHPRSGVLSTLLEDLENDLPIEEVQRRFKKNLDPMIYQRPQKEASEGNIQQAEKLVAERGLAPSMQRRFAYFDEVPKLWEPSQEEEAVKAAGGVFGSLRAKRAAGTRDVVVAQHATQITFAKFQRDVLDAGKARGIEVYVGGSHNFVAITGPVHLDAPPIFQWDHEEQRNPYAWYLYNGGSHYSKWGLERGWNTVTGVCLKPSFWYETPPNDAPAAIFLIEGAADHANDTLGLFPETLRSDLHVIRRTIAEYSESAKLENVDEASACGLQISGKSASIRVRVDFGNKVFVEYEIDRFD